MSSFASSPAVRSRMQRQSTRETGPELALRSLLHRQGLRFRVHRRPVAGLRRVADIVFPTEKVAVFVDGCFWHVCPDHASWPVSNADFWSEKLIRNAERDRETDVRLAEEGWNVVRVWEHEDPAEAASLVVAAVRRSRRR